MNKIVLALLLLLSLKSFAQPPAGKFVKDQKSGCLIWSDNYPTDIVTWSGGCKDNYADGEGILSWYQENNIVAEFTGRLEKGIPQGKGKYNYPGWCSNEGNFIDGLIQGEGVLEFANGHVIKGNFTDGDFLDLDRSYLAHLQRTNLNIKDSTGIYSGGGNLYYYALVPEGSIRSVLVLLPSTTETTQSVISCSKKLMQKCYDNNILTVVLSANENKGLESDTHAMNFFNSAFTDIVERYKAPKDKIILSGLSLGGENAIHYTELSRSNPSLTSIKPFAAIGIDPPVDMADLYHNAIDEIALYSKKNMPMTPGEKMAIAEDNFLIDYFNQLYGGSPEEIPEKYIEGSEFSRNTSDGGNAKYLVDVPLRIYSDPDIVWQLKNRNRDYYHMNAPNQSAMINFLMLSGNTRAEFISALGKGYRLDGSRHPHSWSIVDPDECIEWILSLIEKK